MRAECRANRTRHERTFVRGETVFRRMPGPGRLPKHLFPEPSTGPYHVVDQCTPTSVVLADAASGALVEGGRNIPLDQILAGPQRANPILTFDTEDEVRGVSQMLLDQTGVGEATLRSGHYAGRRKGWGPLSYGCFVAFQTVPQGPKSRELTVGKVLELSLIHI